MIRGQGALSPKAEQSNDHSLVTTVACFSVLFTPVWPTAPCVSLRVVLFLPHVLHGALWYRFLIAAGWPRIDPKASINTLKLLMARVCVCVHE